MNTSLSISWYDLTPFLPWSRFGFFRFSFKEISNIQIQNTLRRAALLCALLPATASAADKKVLILTTDETGHADSTAALGRFVDGFAAAAGGVGNIIDRRGALAAGTLTDDDFADADVVAIASGCEAISAADSARIIT